MEHFLSREEEYCLDCCARRSFRVSRFGCVFSCSCRGKLLDFQHVLQGFVSDLVLGGRNVEFLPCVSGSVATDRFKVVQVELDFINNAALVTFANISSSDAIQILSGLPLSLGEWTQTADGGFRYPIDSVDILLQELKLMTRERGEQLYVNGPTKRCMDVVPSPRTVDKEYLAKLLPKKLFAALHQHQINGILQALSFGGRALFADEMGVGKTLQAIGTVVALRAFPVLIVCPAALRFMWSEEVEKWLMEVVELDDIHVITSSSDFLPAKENPKIVITSFHMASLLATHLQGRRWKCLVVDESHMLHTTVDDCGDARYTSLLCELGKHAKHCLLLSGTPSPTTPFDLYNQIDTLVPGLLGLSRFEFALRYCRIEFTPHFKPRECTRSTELHSLLRTTCMIRRLKTETLIDLPSKQRVLLRVAEHEMCLDVAKPPFQKTYAENWMKKNDKIGGVVDFLLSKHNKLVLFAHHIALLDMLTKHVSEKGVSCIRVDGNTPTHSRAEILSMFNSGETRVAIMGITACGVGIQLTGASCALFAELPPDVTWMQQAEDRLHRPGQKKNVTFFYVIGSGSLFDSAHFNRLSSSFQAVRQVTDGVSSSLSASYSTSIISVQETLLEEERNLHASLHGRGALYEISDTATQFLFRISSNTGRIHVSSGDAHLLSLSPYEVRCYWTQKDNFSSQLREYLTNAESLSPLERRQLRLSGIWLASNFSWRPSMALGKTTARYSKNYPLFGRVFFWKVSKLSVAPRVYGALLASAGDCYKPMCLECQTMLSPTFSFFPGAVVDIKDDTQMFCCGGCRRAFYLKRSWTSIRRGVLEADKGICTSCHVDCELLCSLAAAAPTRMDREKILDEMHPQLRNHPTLFHRFVERPVPGNIWNVDHILPVKQGGGEADISNLQTLCVACHANKTASEAKIGRGLLFENERRTTVDVSALHFVSRIKRRVTNARIEV